MTESSSASDHLRQHEAFVNALEEIVTSVNDEVSFGAAINQVTQLAKQLDIEQLLNRPQTPKQATADQAPVLQAMLATIPDGYGRWIDCGPGWYPLLITLHTKLQKLVPGYQIHQIKEKYGQLCYYWGGSGRDDRSYPGNPDNLSSEFALQTQRNINNALAQTLVDQAEELSETICETCGEPGQLCCTAAASPWYQTVCPQHQDGMMPAQEWPEWWQSIEPRFHAWQRGNFLRAHSNHAAVVLCADPDRRIILPEARYINDPDQARAYADSDSFALVFVATDPVGQAFMRGLESRYRAHGQAVLTEQGKRAAAGDRFAINN
jgi:hypothetical protein